MSCKWGLSVHNSIGRKNTLPAIEAPAALCVHMSILPPFRILCLYVEHFKVYYSGLPIYSDSFMLHGFPGVTQRFPYIHSPERYCLIFIHLKDTDQALNGCLMIKTYGGLNQQ